MSFRWDNDNCYVDHPLINRRFSLAAQQKSVAEFKQSNEERKMQNQEIRNQVNAMRLENDILRAKIALFAMSSVGHRPNTMVVTHNQPNCRKI